MKRFSNPLDNIRVASPCSVDWNQMYGSNRKRFCGDCKLNVYNLSDMTRQEAENFLMTSEGRVCVRFYRRSDGTVLTKNCPVGWKATVQKASRAFTASLSLIAGLFFGLIGIRAADSFVSILPLGEVPPVEGTLERVVAGGLDEVPTAGEPDLTDFRRAKTDRYATTLGRVVKIEKLEDKKVVAWVK